MEAYKAKALPAVATVADVLRQAFNGRSLLVGASGDFQFAAALGVHQFLQGENPSTNAATFVYDSEVNFAFHC